jgi:hypothetical protein
MLFAEVGRASGDDRMRLEGQVVWKADGQVCRALCHMEVERVILYIEYQGEHARRYFCDGGVTWVP